MKAHKDDSSNAKGVLFSSIPHVVSTGCLWQVLPEHAGLRASPSEAPMVGAGDRTVREAFQSPSSRDSDSDKQKQTVTNTHRNKMSTKCSIPTILL